MSIHSDLGTISIFRAEFERLVLPSLIGFNGKVLDLGCSTAIYRDIFQKEYVGMDLNNTEFPKNSEKDQFIVGIGYHLPFKKNSFDLVFCNGVLEHTEYPEIIIAEISRVLKRGETVFISVPTHTGFKWESDPKYRAFTFNELETLLNSNNLFITNHKYGGGIIAQGLHTIETYIAQSRNNADKKEETKRWDPQMKTSKKNPIFGIRRHIIDIISSLEIKSGICGVHSQGMYIWAKKRYG
jgi:ubiquinone/menaquinone biosynthesis C-methylase UbiE